VLIYFCVGEFATLTTTKIGDHPQYDKHPYTYRHELTNNQLLGGSFLRSMENGLSSWFKDAMQASRMLYREKWLG